MRPGFRLFAAALAVGVAGFAISVPRVLSAAETPKEAFAAREFTILKELASLLRGPGPAGTPNLDREIRDAFAALVDGSGDRSLTRAESEQIAQRFAGIVRKKRSDTPTRERVRSQILQFLEERKIGEDDLKIARASLRATLSDLPPNLETVDTLLDQYKTGLENARPDASAPKTPAKAESGGKEPGVQAILDQYNPKSAASTGKDKAPVLVPLPKSQVRAKGDALSARDQLIDALFTTPKTTPSPKPSSTEPFGR